MTKCHAWGAHMGAPNLLQMGHFILNIYISSLPLNPKS